MGIGLLFINNGHQDIYLPVFCKDPEFALSVLTDAMKKCSDSDVKPHCHPAENLFEIANNLGRERMQESHFWIGPEAVSTQCLGGVENACQDASYIFAVDFENWKIVIIK